MKQNPFSPGVVTPRFAMSTPVTRERVSARARELTVLAGRPDQGVQQADYEQAKREVTGEADLDRQNELLDADPVSACWMPATGSEGRPLPESPSEDEDGEGRSETEQLVEVGAEEAERDRMLQAARLTREIK
ncbi:MAG: hypothetical protein ABIZ04_14850 [Opitutus sp.]